MKSFIAKLFKENGFKEIEIENIHKDDITFFGNYSNNLTNFYLVLYIDKIEENFLTERVPNYFSAIKTIKEGYDERIDKNLSMIVCYRESVKEDITKQNKIYFDIEEDPYYFKKYLLSYSDMEEEKLLELFYEEDSTTELINNVVTNTEYFEKFKSEVVTDSSILYKICSKMMIKIPFINLNYIKDELENLSDKISTIMDEKDLDEFRNMILSNEFTGDDEMLKKILEFKGLEANEDE
ncbi:MAG: ABC-three component system middle component 1 [Carnobacterium sp.]|uniref:ABC-three component system middle component 1 n=1 Tax=Carnobacterium sp. TaxID=48221 RepID=UPI0033161DE1